jgi:hypothetical protein
MNLMRFLDDLAAVLLGERGCACGTEKGKPAHFEKVSSG